MTGIISFFLPCWRGTKAWIDESEYKLTRDEGALKYEGDIPGTSGTEDDWADGDDGVPDEGIGQIEVRYSPTHNAPDFRPNPSSLHTAELKETDVPRQQPQEKPIDIEKRIPVDKGFGIDEHDAYTPSIRFGGLLTIEEGVALRKSLITQILREAANFYGLHRRGIITSSDFELQLQRQTDELADYFPNSEGMKADQQLLIESGRYYSVYLAPEREVEQSEITGTLNYFEKLFDGYANVYPHVIALHCDKTLPANKQKEALLHLKSQAHDFLSVAQSRRALTLAILNYPGHWLAFVADNRAGKPEFLVFDTAASVNNHIRRKKSEDYVRRLKLISGDQVNENNTRHMGSAMQVNTPNACGPLACWVLESLGKIVKEDSQYNPDALFTERIQEWEKMDVSTQKRMVMEQRAEILARMACAET